MLVLSLVNQRQLEAPSDPVLVAIVMLLVGVSGGGVQDGVEPHCIQCGRITPQRVVGKICATSTCSQNIVTTSNVYEHVAQSGEPPCPCSLLKVI